MCMWYTQNSIVKTNFLSKAIFVFPEKIDPFQGGQIVYNFLQGCIKILPLSTKVLGLKNFVWGFIFDYIIVFVLKDKSPALSPVNRDISIKCILILREETWKMGLTNIFINHIHYGPSTAHGTSHDIILPQ